MTSLDCIDDELQTKSTVTLISSDQIEFTVDTDVATTSSTLLSTLVENCVNDERKYQLNIKSEILREIISFMRHHKTENGITVNKPITESDLKVFVSKWDIDFVESLDLAGILIDTAVAANYLHIESLLDLISLKSYKTNVILSLDSEYSELFNTIEKNDELSVIADAKWESMIKQD